MIRRCRQFSIKIAIIFIELLNGAFRLELGNPDEI
jgi:hypothetical protein